MRLSSKKWTKLYNAIYQPILSIRLRNAIEGIEDLDDELESLERRIFKEIKDALGLED